MLYRFLFLLTFTWLSNTLHAQEIEIFKSGSAPNSGYVRINNAATLGDKSAGAISYADIGGSPFWRPEWNAALLVCPQNQLFMLPKARLNVYTGEVHYLSETGKEMIATSLVNAIIFYKGSDTAEQLAAFQKFSFTDSRAKNNFYQVLNNGNTRLLKLFTASLDKRFDPLLGQTIYQLNSKYEWFLAVNETAKSLKKLDKHNIFEYIPSSAAVDEWLKTNKNSLKNEAQVTSFLDYYNSIAR